MSLVQRHSATEQFGDETMSLLVYPDGSASFAILQGNAVQSMRSLDPHEDGSDIAICGDVKTWFDKELAAGRAKAGES